ncbi:hypothetical protein FRC08_014017 [Ceratobasidium sp. 394]|nr:hypothetical protein FRC08_014017 [Ceratobasidium sp. 394]
MVHVPKHGAPTIRADVCPWWESGDAAGAAAGQAQGKDDVLLVHVSDTIPREQVWRTTKAAQRGRSSTPPSGSPSEPRRVPGQNATDPRSTPNPTDNRIQQNVTDSRIQQNVTDSRMQQPDESSWGAQSVDEPRRDREGSRRGGQSVDKSGASWRQTPGGQSEDEGRSGDEARRARHVRSPNGVDSMGQLLGVVGAGGPPPRPPRRSEDEGVLDRARSPPGSGLGQGQEQLERVRTPQDAPMRPAPE